MSKKLTLIADIEHEKLSPKLKYQLFEIELGFEKVSVLIPFDKVSAFENDAVLNTAKSSTTIIKLAIKYGGSER